MDNVYKMFIKLCIDLLHLNKVMINCTLTVIMHMCINQSIRELEADSLFITAKYPYMLLVRI